MQKILIVLWLFIAGSSLLAQPGRGSHWTPKGDGFYFIESNEIHLFDISSQLSSVVISSKDLTPAQASNPLTIKDYTFSKDGKILLVYTNSKRVWRYETRGDYWVLDLQSGRLTQLGKSLPESSLMFAKLSPDGTQAAYVSQRNIYLESIDNHQIKKLTSTDGKEKLINGTFDWVYEEEFDCRDGFRWSPDSRKISFWQIDASDTRDFYMINTIDSIYAFNVPVEYPKVGETPSLCRIGVIHLESGKTEWMEVPGDNRQNYIPRMDWAGNSDEIVLQQLNRHQNRCRLMYANIHNGETQTFYEETDDAWISVRSKWDDDNTWKWSRDRSSMMWITEKDGWRHLYTISRDGSRQDLTSKGEFDVIDPLMIDEPNGYVYYTASPDNATEKYLYRSDLKTGLPVRLTPRGQKGTHRYQISPDGKYAYHTFSNYFTPPMREWIKLNDHSALDPDKSINRLYNPDLASSFNLEFFTVTTDEGIEMDAWMVKPDNFDPTKKYPTLFYVYSEPAGATVINRYGIGRTGLYNGNLAADGYVYISIDNRGTPAPKGREWRKSIYRKIGIINIDDQASACKKILEQFGFIDPERIAVHGWSGGGTATLNLLFRYPELYQTGIGVAAVVNQLTYDNIYQERYMGLPQENMEDFINGSPITHAKNLQGNLLYIHGTGDDNVHYQNAELLINELVKHNKQFQFMPYPNRSHGIHEGQGTRRHLMTLFTNFLRTHCPPGPR